MIKPAVMTNKDGWKVAKNNTSQLISCLPWFINAIIHYFVSFSALLDPLQKFLWLLLDLQKITVALGLLELLSEFWKCGVVFEQLN